MCATCRPLLARLLRHPCRLRGATVCRLREVLTPWWRRPRRERLERWGGLLPRFRVGAGRWVQCEEESCLVTSCLAPRDRLLRGRFVSTSAPAACLCDVRGLSACKMLGGLRMRRVYDGKCCQSNVFVSAAVAISVVCATQPACAGVRSSCRWIVVLRVASRPRVDLLVNGAWRVGKVRLVARWTAPENGVHVRSSPKIAIRA